MAPLEHHIGAYITVVGGNHSKLQSLPSEGEGDHHSPTGDISIRRLHFTSCIHPPAILNQLLGKNLQGVVILMGMTRRSPFQEGEDGFPRDNHLQLLVLCNQMEDGFLRDHLLTPKACSSKCRCGVPNQHFSIGVVLGYPKNKHL